MGPRKRVPNDRWWPPRDRDGTIPLHRFELPTWLAAVPGMVRFFSEVVPDEMWSYDADGETTLVLIACPCGAEPSLRFGLRSFNVGECDCGRFFMHTGKELRVGRAES